jgi:hypothetical protein
LIDVGLRANETDSIFSFSLWQIVDRIKIFLIDFLVGLLCFVLFVHRQASLAGLPCCSRSF